MVNEDKINKDLSTLERFVEKRDFSKIFGEKLNNAIETEKIQHFRLCVDQKNNIYLANLSSQWSNLSGEFIPTCPSDTKKTIDIVITPTVEKYRIPRR